MIFSKRKIILQSWELLKKHLGLWVLIMLFVLVISIITSILQEQLMNNGITRAILFAVAAYLFQAGIKLGTLKIALNIHNKNEVNLAHVLGSFHLLIVYISSTIIFLLLLLAAAFPGILLFIVLVSSDLEPLYNASYRGDPVFILSLLAIAVPTVYASIRMQFYDYFIIDEERGAMEAIIKSTALTRSYTGELFILGAIMSTIILISIIPLMIGLLVSVPLSTMVNAHVYLSLKDTTTNG